MRVTFVYYGAESLGIEYLSSYLKKTGHQTSLAFDFGLFADKRYLNIPWLNKIFNPSKEKLIARIRGLNPDLIAFSVIKDLYAWALDLAKEIKSILDVPVVFGGVHPTSVPEQVIKNDCVDYIIVGEGEEALAELVLALEEGSSLEGIKNLWFKNGSGIIKNQLRFPIKNLDDIPFPDKELFSDFIPIDDSYTIMASRGCPLTCSFCCSSIFTKLYRGKGNFFRFRTIENVISELRIMKERYNFREVDFCDDVFTVDSKWLKEFLKAYKKEIDLPFRCLSHPKYFNKEIGQLLKENGCLRIRISPQTMNEDLRKRVLNRHESNQEVERAFNICDEIKLPYTADHLFGIPEESCDDHLQAARVYSNTHYLGKISCYYLEYFPGTDILDYARKQGVLDQSDVESINQAHGKGYYEFNTAIRKDKEEMQMAESFKRFFEIIPGLPIPLRKFILNKRIYLSFYRFPRSLFFMAMVFIEILRKDPGAIPYFKYYLRNILTANKKIKL